MEPLTSGAIAVAALILNKAFEKTGEKLGEAVSQQIGKLGQMVQRKALPKTAAIEQANQPIDFGQAVLEIEASAATDGELAQTVEALAKSVAADPKLAQEIRAYAAKFQQSPPATMHHYSNQVQEIKNQFQGNVFNAPVTFN